MGLSVSGSEQQPVRSAQPPFSGRGSLSFHCKEAVTGPGDPESKGENAKGQIYPEQDLKLARRERREGKKRKKVQTAEAFTSIF